MGIFFMSLFHDQIIFFILSGFTIVFLVSLVSLRNQYYSISKTLNQILDYIRKDGHWVNRYDISENIKFINNVITKSKNKSRIKPITLGSQGDQSFVIDNTLFNIDSHKLVKSDNWFNILPGLFILCGLLLTFFFIAYSLFNVHNSFNNSQVDINSIINQLIQTLSQKFSCSIFGIFYSILFIVFKLIFYSKLDFKINTVAYELNNRINHKTTNEIINNISEAITEQKDTIKEIFIGEPFKEMMVEVLNKSNQVVLTPMFEKLNSSLSKLNSYLSENSMSNIQKTYTKLVEHLQTTLLEINHKQHQNMKEFVQNIGNKMKDTSLDVLNCIDERVSETINSINQQFEHSMEKIADFSVKYVDRVEMQIQKLDYAITQLNELEKIASSNTEVIEQLNILIDRFNEQISKSESLVAEFNPLIEKVSVTSTLFVDASSKLEQIVATQQNMITNIGSQHEFFTQVTESLLSHLKNIDDRDQASKNMNDNLHKTINRYIQELNACLDKSTNSNQDFIRKLTEQTTSITQRVSENIDSVASDIEKFDEWFDNFNIFCNKLNTIFDNIKIDSPINRVNDIKNIQ